VAAYQENGESEESKVDLYRTLIRALLLGNFDGLEKSPVEVQAVVEPMTNTTTLPAPLAVSISSVTNEAAKVDMPKPKPLVVKKPVSRDDLASAPIVPLVKPIPVAFNGPTREDIDIMIVEQLNKALEKANEQLADRMAEIAGEIKTDVLQTVGNEIETRLSGLRVEMKIV
jgi:hypothetical protein